MVTRADHDPIICVCKQVSEDEIVAVIEAGANDLPAILAACGASTECGTCTDDVRELLAEVGR